MLGLLAVGLMGGACGDDRDRGGAERPRTAAEPAPTPGGTPRARGERARRGRQLVAQSGCLACHRFGDAGNDAPGPELSSVGERLPASVIARTLVNPTAPMPSFAALPARDRRAIVAYLVTLRGPDRAQGIRGENRRE